MKRKHKVLNCLYFITISSLIFCICGLNKAVTVISESLDVEREHTIIIDAGHGGEDGGATSCSGRLESCYNLEIASKLNDLFHFLGYQTKMIRTSDISIYTKGETIAQKKISDLKERVRICNETDKAILLSIHQNIFPDARYSGAQVFYADTEGSYELANKLQNELKRTLNPDSKRQVKKAEGVYLIDHIQCAGVLIECGFLSNPEEEAKLRDTSYQKQLCCVIAVTVSNFLDG